MRPPLWKVAFQLTGWTQDYLVESVECSRQTVGKFLAGGDVDRPIFEAICSKLNLRVADIADDESHELAFLAHSLLPGL